MGSLRFPYPFTLATAFAAAFSASISKANADDADPSTDEHVLVFEPPHIWKNADSEVWTLKAPTGTPVCRLPCAARVGPSSGYRIEGLGTYHVVSERAGHREEETQTSTASLALPDSLSGPAGAYLFARVRPGHGFSARGAIALGVIAGAVTIGGAAMAIGAAAEQCSGLCPVDAGGPGPGFVEFVGFVVLGLGVTLGTVALVGGLTSEGPKLVVSPEASSKASEREASPVYLRFSPTGVVGVF
jgi:hypothetical protein